jgi:hypothetical protein
MYCVFLGKAVQTVNPPSGSVGTAQIADLAVTSAKLASGVLPDNTPAFRARLSADFVHNSNNTFLKVPFATEDYDTDNAYDSTTNYRFTVPSGQAGKYFVNSALRATYNCSLNIAIYKNGSLTYVADAGTNGSATVSPQITTTMNLSVSDYIEIYAFQQSGGSQTFTNNSGVYPWFEMYKLIGV